MNDDKSRLMEEIVEILKNINDDTSIPKNIRRGAMDAIDTLKKNDQELDVRAASAIYILDELANDPNIPLHGRTLIWGAISRLEALSAE